MKGKIRIDKERCKGCYYCVYSCPRSVIVISQMFNQSGYFPAEAGDKEKCSGCALCAMMCPEIAIEVYRNSRKAPAQHKERKKD